MAKILIVDDEPDIRSALGRFFARSGHDVLRASTGEEAVLLVQTERPAVVLLDLELAGGDPILDFLTGNLDGRLADARFGRLFRRSVGLGRVGRLVRV